MPESSLPQKRSISIAEPSSNAPISPLVLTAENDSALRLDTITEHVEATHTSRQRAKSTPSLSFALADPKAASPSSSPKVSVSTPKAPKASPVVRLRGTSPPPPARFENRVSFDNVEHGDPTEHNTISFTLNVKHEGYQYKRQSRTFMVGVDDNPYSNIALQFVLQELIDDGDQIVCIRVVDKEAKIVSDRALETKKYRQEANTLMEALQKRNGEQRALNIILEFAVGKLEDTFLKMLEIYNPAMLIVGTRGRSLGGIQGLMANRNSFSKWCLQFCSVPVVVVRPTEKRMKKKLKRGSDPARRDYVRILRESGIETHETEAAPSTHQFEASNSPHLEAHAVAVALGLPGQFDPTITPIDLPGSTPLRQVDSAASAVSANTATTSDSRSPSPNLVRKKSPPPKPAQDSEDESGEDEDEEESSDEFEAVPGVALLGNADKQKKLHDMEVGEAAALAGRKNSIASVSSGSGGSGKGEVVVGERKLSIGSVSSGSGISGKSAAEEEEEKTNEKEDSDEKQDEGSGIVVADKGVENDEGEKDAGEKYEAGKDEEEKNEGENYVAVVTTKLEIAGD